jgi:hypothetical protein
MHRFAKKPRQGSRSLHPRRQCRDAFLDKVAPEEIAAWYRHVAKARLTKGYEIMWSRMHLVRDVQFDSFEAVNCGKMTSGLL